MLYYAFLITLFSLLLSSTKCNPPERSPCGTLLVSSSFSKHAAKACLQTKYPSYSRILINDLGIARFIEGDYASASSYFHKAIFGSEEDIQAFEIRRETFIPSLKSEFPLHMVNSVKNLAWCLQVSFFYM